MGSTDHTTPSAGADDGELKALVARFATGELDAAGRRRLAAIVRADPAAAAVYRRTLEQTAALGHAVRARRQQEAVRRDEVLRERRVRERTETRRGVRADKNAWARVRTLVLPAFFAFLIWQISKITQPPPGIVATWTSGEVEANGEPMGAERAEVELHRGDYVLLRGPGDVELECGDTEIGLRGQTWVLVEEVEPLRLRLEAGGLDVAGEATITAPTGIAEVEHGRAVVSLEGGLLAVHCIRGRALLVDARGEVALARGERAGGPTAVAADARWAPPPSDG